MSRRSLSACNRNGSADSIADYEYNHHPKGTAADQRQSIESMMTGYEQFLKAELPSRVKKELETRVEDAIHCDSGVPYNLAGGIESLKNQVVDIVRNAQIQLFEAYRLRLSNSRQVDLNPPAFDGTRSNDAKVWSSRALLQAGGATGGSPTTLAEDGLFQDAFETPWEATGDGVTDISGFEGVIFDLSSMSTPSKVGFGVGLYGWDDCFALSSLR